MFCGNMIRIVVGLMKQTLIPVSPLQKTFLMVKFGKFGIPKMKSRLRNGQSVVPEVVLNILLEIRIVVNRTVIMII